MNEIPLNEIYCDSDFNCRGRIAPIDVIDLVQSIDSVGLLEPIVVEPYDKVPGKKYRIIVGYRRFTAFRVMGKETIPATIREGLTDLQARTINLVENLKRQDLNIVQEAKALQPYLNYGWDDDTIAHELHVTVSWVKTRLNVLGFPSDIQNEIAKGIMNNTQINQLASLTREKQYEAIRMVKEKVAKGEKATINFRPVKYNPFKKKQRDRSDVFAIQDHIREQVGNNILTRLCGWFAGEVSDYEIHLDMERHFGKDKYQLPKELTEQLRIG